MSLRRPLGLIVALGGAAAVTLRLAGAEVNPPPAPHSLEIRGSVTASAIAEPVAEALMALHPEAVVTVAPCGVPRAIKSLVVGTSQMALATDELSEESAKLAEDHHVKLEKTEVFRDALVIVVDPSNPVRDLTLDQVGAIFRGAIRDWSEVGGAAGAIEVISPPADTGAAEVFKRRVLGADAVLTPRAVILPTARLKASFHPTSIGYAPISQVVQQGLHAVSVNGVTASPETIRLSAYPIIRVMAVYQRSPPTPLGAELVAYLLGPEGAKVITAGGSIPMSAPPPGSKP